MMQEYKKYLTSNMGKEVFYVNWGKNYYIIIVFVLKIGSYNHEGFSFSICLVDSFLYNLYTTVAH